MLNNCRLGGMKIHNPDAPVDNKTWHLITGSDGSLQLMVVDDANAAHSKIEIERQGITVFKITIDGKEVYKAGRINNG